MGVECVERERVGGLGCREGVGVGGSDEGVGVGEGVASSASPEILKESVP